MRDLTRAREIVEAAVRNRNATTRSWWAFELRVEADIGPPDVWVVRSEPDRLRGCLAEMGVADEPGAVVRLLEVPDPECPPRLVTAMAWREPVHLRLNLGFHAANVGDAVRVGDHCIGHVVAHRGAVAYVRRHTRPVPVPEPVPEPAA